MPDEPDDMQIKTLWGLRPALKKNPSLSTGSYCGHEGNLEQLEGKLWEYAEGSMPETEADRFWEQTQGCKYCLQKYLSIQQAISQISREQGYSLQQIKSLLEQKRTTGILRVALNWIKDSLELIATTGLILPLEPVPVTRGIASAPPKIIKVAKEFEKAKVEVWAEPSGSGICNIEVKIIPPPSRPLPENLRVSLTAFHRLLASYSVSENRVNFEELPPGSYKIELMDRTEVWGQILLDINPG